MNTQKVKLIQKLKAKSGITLIALVITIIVLLILAGITINLILGQDGIFKIADEAKFKTTMAKYKEQVDLYVVSVTLNKLSDEANNIHAGEPLKKIIQSDENFDIKKEDIKLDIKTIIKEIKTSEEDYVVVYKGNMCYVSNPKNENDDKYIKWCNDIGIKVLTIQKLEGMDIRNGKYELVNDMYICTPNLMTGFEKENTRYLNVNENNVLTPGKWINEKPDANWYNYAEQKWANIYVENGGLDVYYTWIPRYCYKVDETKLERTDVKFIDVDNTYKDKDGNITKVGEGDLAGYQVPEAFEFNEQQLAGYWAMKYTCGDTITPSIISYKKSTSNGKVTLKNITLNTTITNANPIATYTLAINGIIKQTIKDPEKVANITTANLVTDLDNGRNVINLTGLNAKGEIVGSMTETYEPAKVNPPELKGFNKDTTFYVTYDANGIETSVIPISKPQPKGWYEYGEARWANIVTRNNGLETYYTWIPRYKYIANQTNQTTDVLFLTGTEEAKEGESYQVPEAFTFNGVPLTGYWAMKYTVGDSTAPIFSTEITSTSNSIKTKGITGSGVGENQTYIYYMNGEEKYRTTNRNENYEYKNLESGKLYTILIDIRNTQTNEYIGTVVKQIKTIEPNKPELIGFNENMTYYVTYEKNEGTGELEEKVGNKIKNDGSNTPQNWYNYSNRMWANIVVTDGKIENGKIIDATVTTYYTWIPRYCYKITPDQTAQPEVGRSEVRFIKDNLTEEEIKEGWLVPEAFTFADKQINGYWAMKYTAGE